MEFLKTIRSFRSRQTYVANEAEAIEDAVRLAEKWGITHHMWDKVWPELSGGESQRLAMAIAVSLPGAKVLLLDGTCIVEIG